MPDAEPALPDHETRRAWGRWSWVVSSSLLALVAVGAPFLLGLFRPAPGEPGGSPTTAAPARDRLREEHHYAFSLAVVELTPRKPGGKRWDVDGSGPDIGYAVRWQDTGVFESTVKNDTLLARWSNTSLTLGDLLDSVSIDSSLKGARITARAGDRLRISIRDADVLDDDEVAAWEVDVADLRVGDQRWETPAPGVVAVIARVLPLEEIDLETLVR